MTRTEALEAVAAAARAVFADRLSSIELGDRSIIGRSASRCLCGCDPEIESLRAALDAAPREEPGEPDYEHAARIAEKWAAHYPVDVFPEDGTSLDAKAAKHGRHVAKMIAEDIRKAAQNVAPPPPEARTMEGNWSEAEWELEKAAREKGYAEGEAAGFRRGVEAVLVVTRYLPESDRDRIRAFLPAPSAQPAPPTEKEKP